jgi:hypothetical protein
MLQEQRDKLEKARLAELWQMWQDSSKVLERTPQEQRDVLLEQRDVLEQVLTTEHARAEGRA